ncbi:hypothetical protein N0V83_004233 [Neocucurbitaria cava]|uniref:DUF7730 domain-containing protein n=1 Tax=Neocucurbitaria cava TaxID=798079 RepID=A0A9W9CNX4_9PLEO|nr:hypothetical protein N0V83_004233 [Neocucurbitaria cava]
MARTLRKKTRKQTKASAKAAETASFLRKASRPLTRRQRYKCNKGLVSLKIPKVFQSITAANATNSPLLSLPAEIREMIWKFAMRSSGPDIPIDFDDTAHLPKSADKFPAASHETLKELAISLPRVCRQVYSEAATMLYSENLFSFKHGFVLSAWLERRILAQREAIRKVALSLDFHANYTLSQGDDLMFQQHKADIEEEIRLLCPNFVGVIWF